ncbi:MAG: hypothetical protein ACOY99_01960 [Pseudomonadota bacterium]
MSLKQALLDGGEDGVDARRIAAGVAAPDPQDRPCGQDRESGQPAPSQRKDRRAMKRPLP